MIESNGTEYHAKYSTGLWYYIVAGVVSVGAIGGLLIEPLLAQAFAIVSLGVCVYPLYLSGVVIDDIDAKPKDTNLTWVSPFTGVVAVVTQFILRAKSGYGLSP